MHFKCSTQARYVIALQRTYNEILVFPTRISSDFYVHYCIAACERQKREH